MISTGLLEIFAEFIDFHIMAQSLGTFMVLTSSPSGLRGPGFESPFRHLH